MGFRLRSAELVDLASVGFPALKVNQWEFFDCNNDLLRVFRLDRDADENEQAEQQGSDKKGNDKKDKKKQNGPTWKTPACPWRATIPTLVASSIIACRKVVVDEEGQQKQITKRLHGLEMMRLMGWDLSMYRNGDAFPEENQTPALLQSLAGNAWCQWHFLPFATAVLGAVDWAEAKRVTPPVAVLKGSDDESASAEDSDEED